MKNALVTVSETEMTANNPSEEGFTAAQWAKLGAALGISIAGSFALQRYTSLSPTVSGLIAGTAFFPVLYLIDLATMRKS